MKIVYDHQVFSLQDAGGATRYFYELIRHLRNRKHISLRLLLGLNHSVYPLAELNGSNSVIVSSRSRLKPGIVRYVTNEFLSNSLSIARGRCDIYHPTLYRRVPLIRGRRVVVTHHDCTHELFPHLFKNAEMVVRNKRRLYAEADAIICVSESSRKDLLRFYPVEEQRTYVIHHGFAPFAEARIDDLPDGISSFRYILFVGARSGYKNFRSLLEAYKATGAAFDYDLVAVGGGKFAADELQAIEQLDIAKRVRLIPLATDALLASLYRNAALFVYPSLYEGFGFPPLEAMSLGCPVLTSRASSMPEICGDAAFYFDPGDPDALAASLCEVLSEGRDKLQMREKGYEQVSRYRWDRTAEQTLEVYRSTLD